jgi:hypothetical protein
MVVFCWLKSVVEPTRTEFNLCAGQNFLLQNMPSNARTRSAQAIFAKGK